MEHGVYLIRSPEQQAAFQGLILPEAFDRLSEDPVFLIGAVEGNRPVGAAVMELEPASARLLSIAVAADRRRQGVGAALLRQCVRVLRRTTIQSLHAILAPEETEPAALFAAFGMTVSDAASACYRLPLADAAGQAVLRGSAGKAQPLETVSHVEVRDYLRRTFPDAPTMSRVEQFDPQLSQLLVEHGRITACLLVEREDGAISVSWMASRSREKLALLYLMRGAVSAAAATCPPETELSFATFEPAVAKLIEELFPQTETAPVQDWELSDGRFRLTDTTPTGWEQAGTSPETAPESGDGTTKK